MRKNRLAKRASCNCIKNTSILGYSKAVSYDTLLRLADIKSLEQRREFQSLVLLYKCLYNQGAPYISEFFNFKNVPYNLRGLSTRLELPYFNMEWMHGSFSFLAWKLWNALPPTIRESKDILSDLLWPILLKFKCIFHL